MKREPGNGSRLWTWLPCYPDVRLVIAQVWPWPGKVPGKWPLAQARTLSLPALLRWGLTQRGPVSQVSDKGTCLTPVTLDIHSRSQRHAPGLWAVTAMTIWTLWVPSFCKARRASCIFKVGCPGESGPEGEGGGETGDFEEAWCGGSVEKKMKDWEIAKN